MRAISSSCEPRRNVRAFVGLEDAVARSQQIADSVDLQLELGSGIFLHSRRPMQRRTNGYLRELCDVDCANVMRGSTRWQNNSTIGPVERRSAAALDASCM